MNPYLAAMWGSFGSLVAAACRYCRAHQRKHDEPDRDRGKSDSAGKPNPPEKPDVQGEERSWATKGESLFVIVLQAWVGAVTAACLAASGEFKAPMIAIGIGFAPESVLRLPTTPIVLTYLGRILPRLGDDDAGKARLTPKLISVGGTDAEGE